MLTFPVLAFADDPIVPRPVSPGSAAAGGAHSILSLPDGRVFTWGKGSQGQLGLGDLRSQSIPTLLTTLGGVTMVAAGGAHSLARSSAGDVYAWGANGSGQLGDGSITTRRSPVLVPLLEDAVMIAAGRAHSLALTADGRVFAWGANDEGQLGLGATLDMTVPTAITTLSNIVAIAAGHSHSLAISRAGELYAWGSNAHGQLGDGSRTNRFTPIRITIGAVVAIAAGRSHTVALLSSGDVYAWGRGNAGQLGTGSVRVTTSPTLIEGLKAIAIDAGGNFSGAVRHDRVLVTWGANRRGQLGDGTTVNRLRPVEVGGLAGISSLSFGDAHAVAVTSNGAVWTWGEGRFGRLGNGGTDQTTPATTMTGIENWGPAIGTVEPPTIEPAGGLYSAAQTVSLKAIGNFVAVRYTLDGTVPTGQSSVYVQPFVVSTASTVRARSVSTFGGELSAETAATFTFNYGQLPVPNVTPSGGTFPQAPLVTIASLPGATVRYTLNGDDPTDTSAAYEGPIQIPAAGAQLKAQAFHVDWSPSAIVTESYITDVTPPTIRADVSPPLADGWMTTPVTVSFVCDDDSGQVTCPAPVVVSEDGRDQLVRGVATDAAGNQASTSVVVSVDLQPPSIAVIDSPDQTSISEAHIAITARVADAGSGVDVALCNGQPVPIANDHAECSVTLRPGANSIAIQARDAVGHLGSLGLTVNRIGAASTLKLSPSRRAMLVNEVAAFSLRDDFGATVTDAAWSSSDAAILEISTDDPPQITAIATGTATITAVKDGLSAEAEITVQAGVALAPGTTRWTIKPSLGFEMDSPIFTTRVDDETPDLFAVETRTWGEATLHALTSEGEVLWRQESPGIPLMGDAFGGVIAGVLFDVEEGIDYRAYVRLGRAGGVTPWRYDSRGLLQTPAQAANGTIYATEYIDTGLRNSDRSKIWEKHLVMLDGRTGARIGSTQLARTRVSFTSQHDGSDGCTSTNVEKAPATVGPVVDAAGRAYLLVHRLQIDKTDVCNESFTLRSARTIDVGVDLFVFEPGVPVARYPIYSAHCESPAGGLVLCDAPVSIHQLVPDGIGGVLAKWERAEKVIAPSSIVAQMMISRVDAEGAIAEHPVATHTWIYSVGQAGIAYLLSTGGYRAMDVATWTPKWISSLGPYTPIAAHPEGGLAVQDEFSGVYQTVNSNGEFETESGMPLPLKAPVQMFDSWIGVATDGLRSVNGRFPDATRWNIVGGNAQKNLRQATPGVGIFAKAHLISLIPYFMHVSIRITPQDPLPWLAHPVFGRYFHDFTDHDGEKRPAVDIYGNVSATIGAGPDGPNGEDTTHLCLFTGVLKSQPNRPKDQLTTPSYQQELRLRGSQNFYIAKLFELDGNYRDQLKYECVPDDEDEFNSNSYASGLIGAADISRPWFPQLFPSMFPGWSKPVPARFFQP